MLIGPEGDFLYGGRPIVYALLAASDPVRTERRINYMRTANDSFQALLYNYDLKFPGCYALRWELQIMKFPGQKLVLRELFLAIFVTFWSNFGTFALLF